MADKIQTGISITQEAHDFVGAFASERGLNFSAALEVIVWDWRNRRQVEARHLARIKVQCAQDPNVVFLEFVEDGDGGMVLRRIDDGGQARAQESLEV